MREFADTIRLRRPCRPMNHAAIDVGASGGTVFLGSVTPESFDVTEVYRFDNRPIESDGRYVWDLDVLKTRIVAGLSAADDECDGLDSVGIDTWGLDFALYHDGSVLRDPTSYRDPEATATRSALFEEVDRRRVFAETGITNWNTPNTLWQIHTLAHRDPEVLDRADRLLMMPQVLSSAIGGDPAGEVTIASTTQMVDSRTRDWASGLLRDLSIPTELLPALNEPGARLGPVSDGVEERLSSRPEIVLPGSHDTSSAVAGLPLDDDAVFLNTGSWFIMGVERSEPVLTDAAYDHAFSNELGVNGTVRLLKNLNGFFLLEECRSEWRENGKPVEYDRLLEAARNAPPGASIVDPDDDAFGIEGSTPDQIRTVCRRTDQPVPTGQGAIVRCLLESLAARTALVLDELIVVSGTTPTEIDLGGGGARNELFCQLLSDATEMPVRAGPVEATAIGNVLAQAVTFETVSSVAAGRELIASEFPAERYVPENPGRFEPLKERMNRLVDA